MIPLRRLRQIIMNNYDLTWNALSIFMINYGRAQNSSKNSYKTVNRISKKSVFFVTEVSIYLYIEAEWSLYGFIVLIM